MNISLKNKDFIQKTLKDNVNKTEIKTYYDKYTKEYYAFSNNGVYCRVRNKEFFDFYRNDELFITTEGVSKELNNYKSHLSIANYIEKAIFFYCSNEVIDKIILLLENKDNISFREAISFSDNLNRYRFTYTDKLSLLNNEMIIIQSDDNHFYYTDNQFNDLFKNLNAFISKCTKNKLEVYKSLETNQLLVKLKFHMGTLICMFYSDSQKLSIHNRIVHHCLYDKEAHIGVPISTTMKIVESQVDDFICKYLFNFSIKHINEDKLKSLKAYDIDFNNDYKETLKLIEMISI